MSNGTTSAFFVFVYAVASGGVCWKGNVEGFAESRSCPVIRCAVKANQG